MIEITVLDYMESALTVPCYMEIPANPPARFVVIEKVGASRENRIEEADFTFQSYAESMAEAAKLNEIVKSAVDNMITLNEVSKCYLNSDYNFTDTSTKHYRYQALYAITYLRKD